MGNIFISSTFKDLNRERTFIKDHIGAQLNSYAEKYAEQYYFTDLRVGVEDTQNNYETINICLTRIKEAAPPDPFIVIVGNSRGWIPAAEDLQQAIDHLPQEDEDIKEMLRQCKNAGKSITELEIAYGAEGLGCEDAASFGERTLFLMMPEADHCENAALRQLILEKFPNQCIPMDLDHPQKAEEKLQAIIDRAHFGQKALSPLQRERKQHLDYMKLKAESFFGREALCAAITKDLARGDGYVYLYGESGIGKSSLVSKIAEELSESMEILPIYCGLTERTDSAANVIEMILAFLKGKMPQFQSDPEELLIDQYQRASEAYLADEKTLPILIAIDAIDQLKPDEYQEKIRFLPMQGNPKLRFLFSGTENGAEIQSRYTGLRELDENQCFYLHPVEGFGKEETAQILTYIFDKELKKGSMPHLVAERLEKSGISNPLYLKMIALRLANLSNRELRELQACSDRGEKYMELIDRFTLDENKQLLPMEQVCLNLLHAACGEKEALLDALQLIALTRHGLPLSFIKELEPQGFSEEDFYVLAYRLRNLFFRHQDGSEDFTHKIFRRALDKTMDRYQKENNHKRIVCGLKAAMKQGRAPFAESIFIYHCIMAENNHEANRFIYRNRPEKTDDEKERQEKQLRLDFAWENLMVCSAEELRSFKVFGSLKKFCLAQMRKKATLTVEEANRQEALLSGVIAEKYEKLEGHLGRNRGKKGWVRTFLLVYLQELEEIKEYIPLLKKYEKTAAASENAGEATICQIWGLYEDICTQEWEQIGYYLGKKHGKAAAAIESIDEILAEMEQPKEEAKESVIRLKTKLEELYRNLGADEDLAAEYMDLLSTIDPSMEKKELLCGTVLEAFDYIKKYVDYYGYQPRVDSCLRQLLQFLESCSSVKDPQQYYLEMAEFLISHYQELLHSDFERFESIRRISFFWILPALDESKKRAWTSLFLKFLELYNHPKLCWESVCWDNLKKVKQLLQESGMYEEFQSELFKISHRWIGRFIYHMEHTVLLTLKPYIVDLEENRLPLAEETKLQVLADLEDYINEKQQNSKESRAYMDRLEHAKGEEIEEIFKNRPKHSKWKHKHFKEVLI